jgi:hypothetical protein
MEIKRALAMRLECKDAARFVVARMMRLNSFKVPSKAESELAKYTQEDALYVDDDVRGWIMSGGQTASSLLHDLVMYGIEAIADDLISDHGSGKWNVNAAMTPYCQWARDDFCDAICAAMLYVIQNSLELDADDSSEVRALVPNIARKYDQTGEVRSS